MCLHSHYRYVFWRFTSLDRTADGNIMEMNNLLSERQTKSGSGASVPSLTDINPEIGNDLTKVTWAHGVNSKKELRRALRGTIYRCHFLPFKTVQTDIP